VEAGHPQLGPDAAEGGREVVRGQKRQEARRLGEEGRAAGRVDPVVLHALGQRLVVGPQAHLSGQVQADVDAQGVDGRVGDGVDQVPQPVGVTRGDGEVAAADPELAQAVGSDVDAGQPGHGVGVQAGCDDDPAAAVGPGLVAAPDGHVPAVAGRGQAGDLGAGQDLGAGIGRAAGIGVGGPLGIEDRRGRGEQGGRGGDLGLQPAQLVAADQAQALDVVGPAQPVQALQLRLLLGRDGHDQLAHVPPAHPAVGAEPLQGAAPLDAPARLEAAGGVVHAAVGHLAVAAGGGSGQTFLALEQDERPVRTRDGGGRRATDDAAADDRHIDGEQGSPAGFTTLDPPGTAGSSCWHSCPRRDSPEPS